MLLSSIAMLLVALVALGSATYAWFTINKTVTADTINVKAVVTSGLQISNTKVDDWQRTVSFNGEYDLRPVSMPIATAAAMPTGFYATDVTSGSSTTKGGAWRNANDSIKFAAAPALPAVNVSALASDTTDRQAKSDYVAVYEVKIRSSGAAIDKPVVANLSCVAPTGAQVDGTTFAKAALVSTDGADAATNFSAITAGDVVAIWTDSGAYTPIASVDGNGDPTLATSAINSATNGVTVLPSVAANTDTAAYNYKLYVWYEGNDPNCDNDYQNAQAQFTLTFTLAD